MISDRLNPRVCRLAFKLQHWMLQYLPGRDNTLADALSREERRQKDTPADHNLGVCLAEGDVEGQPPHEGEIRAGSPDPAGRT